MTMPLHARMPLPGLVWGAYPERREPPQVRWPWARAPYLRQVAAVRRAMGDWQSLDDTAFAARLP